MDRLRQMALAQKTRLMETLTTSPQSILHSIIEGDKNVTRVVIDGEVPQSPSAEGGDFPAGGDASSPLTSSTAFYSTEMVCAILRAVEDSRCVTHLTIMNRTDAQEFISALTPIFSKNLVLKHIKMDSVEFGDDLSMPLFGTLAKNTSIETAAFRNISLTSVQGVCLLLKHTHALKSLDLSNNSFDEDAFMTLAEGLRMVTSTELKELRLTNTGITDAALNRICCVLEENIEYCPSLRMIDYGPCEGIEDATRLRIINVVDQRLTRAAEMARGSFGSPTSATTKSNKISDKGSDRLSAAGGGGGGGGGGVCSPPDSTANAAEESVAATDAPAPTEEGAVAADGPSVDDDAAAAATSPRQTVVQQSPSKVPAEAVASPSSPTITQADIASAVAAAVAAANQQHEQKMSRLAELLGDSQAQAARLQEELQLRGDKIADLQSGTKAIKDASKVMHQQFQSKVLEAETAAMGKLTEAADLIGSLKKRLTDVTANATQQKAAYEEAMKAVTARNSELEAENVALRTEYLAELRAAVDAQQAAAEAAKHAPPRFAVDAETQTDAAPRDEVGGNGSMDRSARSVRTASNPPAAAVTSSPTPPSAAEAYDDAIDSFALVDAEEFLGKGDGGDGSKWKRDEDVTHCSTCRKEFTTLTRRKHHCRRCGGIYCSDCTTKSKADSKMVCHNCCRSEEVLTVTNAKKK